jgi:hypothetical protein
MVINDVRRGQLSWTCGCNGIFHGRGHAVVVAEIVIMRKYFVAILFFLLR